MIKSLLVEFSKARRRKVWLVVAAMIAAQLVWALWALQRMDARDLEQGWMFSLYQFPLLNSIMMPVIAAVIASRLCDAEHKGQTFRLLRTIMPAGELFDVKFLSGTVYIAAAALLQTTVILIMGKAAGYGGEIPLENIVYYLFFTIAVSSTILLLQQALSLLWVNQMVSLTVGLLGGFIGLFSLFLPQSFQKFFLWSYFGVLMFVRMDWDRATRITDLHWTQVDWSGFATLVGMFLMIYVVGRTLFVRKEL